jgi:antitoxin HigA-1
MGKTPCRSTTWTTIDRDEVLAMAIKHPPHPGLSVRYDCLESLGLSVTDGAKVLGVSRQALTNLVTGKAAISPEMAIRLDKAFGGGAETWLALQTAYDLAQVRRNESAIKVKRYVAKRKATQLEPA